MPGREPSDPGVDDWFDEPQPRAASRSVTDSREDDWLEESTSVRPVVPRLGALAGRRGLTAVAAALALLLIGLAAGGVFSGSSRAPTPPATTPPTTASTPPPAQAAPTVPSGPLKPGAKGAQVRTLQKALAGLGYSPGKIDGSYGPATQKALADFQRASKLNPDGVLGPKTLAALKKAAQPSR